MLRVPLSLFLAFSVVATLGCGNRPHRVTIKKGEGQGLSKRGQEFDSLTKNSKCLPLFEVINAIAGKKGETTLVYTQDLDLGVGTPINQAGRLHFTPLDPINEGQKKAWFFFKDKSGPRAKIQNVKSEDLYTNPDIAEYLAVAAGDCRRISFQATPGKRARVFEVVSGANKRNEISMQSQERDAEVRTYQLNVNGELTITSFREVKSTPCEGSTANDVRPVLLKETLVVAFDPSTQKRAVVRRNFAKLIGDYMQAPEELIDQLKGGAVRPPAEKENTEADRSGGGKTVSRPKPENFGGDFVRISSATYSAIVDLISRDVLDKKLTCKN